MRSSILVGSRFPKTRPWNFSRSAVSNASAMHPTAVSGSHAEAASKRIHVLGMGSIGSLVAHGLASLPPETRPPITLLMHRQSLRDEFDARNKGIRLVKNVQGDEDADERTGFDVEVVSVAPPASALLEEDQDHGSPNNVPSGGGGSEDDGHGRIYSLVLAVKGAATVQSVQSIRPRLLGSQSTILFLQNGMGQMEELNEQVFPDPATRPRYVQGIISHGVYLTGPFTAVHAGKGAIQLGMVKGHPPPDPSTPKDDDSVSSSHLIETIQAADCLNSRLISSDDILTTQLLKLATNAIINPLTALLDIPNGHQLTNSVISSSIIPTLIAEISNIILSLPEIKAAPESTRRRFEKDALAEYTREVIHVNRSNSSSMREDMKKRRETEIKYINGYLVKRGTQCEVDVTLNEFLLKLIEAKTSEVQREAAGY